MSFLIIAMIIGLFAVLSTGFPVVFSLAGTAIVFAGLGHILGVFELSYLAFFPNRIYGLMTNEVLIAVPLFVFMGTILEHSKVAEEMLEAMGRLFGSMPGGLGISVCMVGALLAASTGVVGATVVTMGLLALPTMLRRGYQPDLACGLIAANGTLGQIIPPSIVLVMLGEVVSNAHIQAQRALGNYAPEPVSVGKLFAGALLPGVLLVTLYLIYLAIVAWLRPQWSPAVPKEVLAWSGIAPSVGRALFAPILLIVLVLGSILAGFATPTEAASVGAIGAIMLGTMKVSPRNYMLVCFGGACLVSLLLLQSFVDLRIMRDTTFLHEKIFIAVGFFFCAGFGSSLLFGLWRTWQSGALEKAMRSTTKISAMLFSIIIAAQLFALVFRGLGGDAMVHGIFNELPGGQIGAIIFFMLMLFVLGFFLDTVEITFIVVPLVAPVVLQMGIDPIWLGIMIAMNLQTSFLTPPFGFALFYLRGVAPLSVSTGAIYRGVAPFVIIQLLMLMILALVPQLATSLPKIVFG